MMISHAWVENTRDFFQDVLQEKGQHISSSFSVLSSLFSL